MIDHFERLDTEVWLPHYLPHWSSRAGSAATYAVEDSELRLTIPPDQGVWCPEQHEEPLRVSGIQSGVHDGQHAFREGLVVLEHQPTQWGWTPHCGRIEVRARMELSPRSMASVWLIGLEDEPDRSGELNVFEVFGDAPRNIGCGIKNFRDPRLTWEFDAPELDIDIAQHHVYAADWQPGRVDFSIDGEHVKTVEQGPDYPMLFIVAVFDFPAKEGPADHVPLLAVDFVSGGDPPPRRTS
jgi:Glycosyl hydrolases family 16